MSKTSQPLSKTGKTPKKPSQMPGQEVEPVSPQAQTDSAESEAHNEIERWVEDGAGTYTSED